MRIFKTIYKKSGWIFIILLLFNIIINYIEPNGLIGYKNIKKVYFYLIIKSISAIISAIFMIIFISKLSSEYYEEEGYGFGHKIVGILFSCFFSAVYLSQIGVQSPYSTYGITDLYKNISVLDSIKNEEVSTEKIELTKYDDNISVFSAKGKRSSSYPSRSQGVQASKIYDSYGIYADSDNANRFRKANFAQLIFNISEKEYRHYKKIFDTCKENDKFIIEFYVDDSGKSLGYIKSVKYK